MCVYVLCVYVLCVCVGVRVCVYVQPVPDPLPDMAVVVDRVLETCGFTDSRANKLDLDDFLKCVCVCVCVSLSHAFTLPVFRVKQTLGVSVLAVMLSPA